MAISAINSNFCKPSPDGLRQGAPLQALTGSVNRGDVAAMTRLGKRLLVGVRAPYLPGAGVDLLTDAARREDPEAPARLAVLAALGVGMRQNWRLALDWLAEAAERNWAPAREQLAVLAAPGAAAAAIGSRRRGLWRCVASTVKLAEWLEPAAGQDLHPDPLVRHHPAFLPSKVCDWLIADARLRLARDTVYDSVTGNPLGHALRRRFGKPFNLMEAGLPHVLVQQRIAASCGVPLDHLEPLRVLRSNVGDDAVPSEALDLLDAEPQTHRATGGQRIATFIVALNGGYDGGDTALPRLGFRHRGGCGDGLVFTTALPNGNPDERAAHRICPPTCGEKWIVSQTVRDGRALPD